MSLFAPREARHRPDVDHLVHRRRERDVRPGHARDARAPDAAGDDDGLGLDIPVGRAHSADAPVLDVDAQHLGLGGDRAGRPAAWPRSRIIVPARSESTTPTPGV